MKIGSRVKWFLATLVIILVIAPALTGCTTTAKEVLPPEVKLIEVDKISQTEYTPDSFFGTKSGVFAATQAKTMAVAEAITTAIDPLIDAAAAGQVPAEAIFGAAMEAAIAKGEEVGLDYSLRKGLAGATGAAAVEAIAGGAMAAKGAAAGASAGVAAGMAESTSVIATNMSAATARSVTVDLLYEVKNPNDFQIKVDYQYYNLSVAGTPTGTDLYSEGVFIPANSTVTIRQRRSISLSDDIIVPMLSLGVPIHGATLTPSEPGSGAVEIGTAIWAKIRIPAAAEQTGDVAAWNKEIGTSAPLNADQISEYLGGVYLGGAYVCGPQFSDAYELATTVTWNVDLELGVDSEYGYVTKDYALSWTEGS